MDVPQYAEQKVDPDFNLDTGKDKHNSHILETVISQLLKHQE